ncbi:glutathione binding-like protein [Mesorhizobium captivum]|uniref:glutathione binding-like protein n=1 Tax=Mesorhizobium captivum TaxID=3072319 RepID=UPI002A239AA7|nr:glutathione binding-like protein [Mesorhizobium sp. VK22B]
MRLGAHGGLRTIVSACSYLGIGAPTCRCRGRAFREVRTFWSGFLLEAAGQDDVQRTALGGSRPAAKQRNAIGFRKGKTVELYYSPLACSLADHIALQEAGASFERETVKLKTKRTASGDDFTVITRKGYVPALVLDNGETLTENVAVLDWIASQYPELGVEGPLGRTRVLEALTYVSTEIHRSFKPMWHQGSDAEKAKASAAIAMQFDLFVDGMKTDYMFGDKPSVADFYLFVMLLWVVRFHIPIPAPLESLRARMAARPAVRVAMEREGLV